MSDAANDIITWGFDFYRYPLVRHLAKAKQTSQIPTIIKYAGSARVNVMRSNSVQNASSKMNIINQPCPVPSLSITVVGGLADALMVT